MLYNLKKFHRNTTSCVVFPHCRPNKMEIHSWVTLFQHNSFLIIDFYKVENMPKKEPFRTHLDTGKGVKISFYLINP